MDHTLGLLAAAPAAAPDQTELPITEGGNTLEFLQMSWLTHSTGQSTAAGTDRLVLAPQIDSVPAHQWQLEFWLSGKDRYDIGSIKIVIPTNIWKDRDGNEVMTIDKMTSTPHESDPDADISDFIYTIRDGNLVITNNKVLDPASSIMIQGHFEPVAAHLIEDMTISDPLFAHIAVQTKKGGVIEATSNSIDAQIDTYQRVGGASKSAYSSSSLDTPHA